MNITHIVNRAEGSEIVYSNSALGGGGGGGGKTSQVLWDFSFNLKHLAISFSAEVLLLKEISNRKKELKEKWNSVSRWK